MHPRLESIQYLDFTVPSSLPWGLLIERIKEIEIDIEQGAVVETITSSKPLLSLEDIHAKAILNYLNQRGYQMASFERIRRRIDPDLSDEELDKLIENNKSLFRHSILKDGKKGLAKIIP